MGSSGDGDERSGEGTKTLHPEAFPEGFPDVTEPVHDKTTRRVSNKELRAVMGLTPPVEVSGASEEPTPLAQSASDRILGKLKARRQEGMEQTGEPFGPYTVLGELGKGGMADVRLASYGSPGARRYCVIKRIIATDEERARFEEMFKEEGRINGMLEHPNIVRLLDAGEIEGVPYLAFELIDGLTLREVEKLLGAHRLPFRAIVEVGLMAASALAHAHAARDERGRPLSVIHRDVTPQNILVDREGTVKLADFGIARFSGRAHKTQHGLVKGKLGYLAPEQITGQEIDDRVDVFSLGLVLAGLVKGARVLPAQLLVLAESASIIAGVMREAGYRVPDSFAELLTLMVSVKPARRPSATEVAARLRTLLVRLEKEAEWQSEVEREGGLLGGELSPRQREGLASFMAREVFSKLPPIDPAEQLRRPAQEPARPQDEEPEGYARTVRAVRPLAFRTQPLYPPIDPYDPADPTELPDPPDHTRLNSTLRLSPGARTPGVVSPMASPSEALDKSAGAEPNYWLIAAVMIAGAIAVGLALILGAG